MRLGLPRLLLMLVVVGSVTASTGALADSSVPRVYLALGDSVAYGTGAGSPLSTYVNTVFQYLKQPTNGGVTLGVILAKSDETSTSFIGGGQLASAVDQINNPDNDASVVTLTLGGNDVLNLVKPGQPCADPQSPACAPAIANALATFTSNYITILQQLKQALDNDPGTERFVVMTYYNPFSGVGGAALPYEQATDAALLGADGVVDCSILNTADPRIGLNDLLTCIGQFYGATVVDVYPPFKNRGLALTHIGDAVPDIHPTDAGHAVIAQAFIRGLTRRAYLPLVRQP